MKLSYSPMSPYVRKVLVCAHELGLAPRIATVPVSVAPMTPNHAYASQNPLMKIPVLERDDGSLLYDSIVICEYLDSLAGPRLFPPAGEARWGALRLHALGDGILDAALLCRYESVARPEALRWQDWLDGQYSKIDYALDFLDANPAGLAGELTIGHVGIGCALGYLDFRFGHRPWRNARPALGRWFDSLSRRESFRKTAPAAA